MARSVYDVQKDFAINSALHAEVIWDSLSADQSHILKQKIETLVPDGDGNVKRTTKMRADLFQSVWLQRKYTNANLLSSIVYVTVSPTSDFDEALVAKQFSCHPVIRTRKCINEDGSSTGCCMIFIDEFGRIYSDWNEYVNKNLLPKGVMVAPHNGVYMLDDSNQVILERHLTPQARSKSRILRTTDTVATASGMAATVPLIASLAVPIAAPVMAAVVAVSVSTSAYSAVRSVMQLKDRRRHGQSTGIRDGEARRSWLGVASGVAGLGSAGATKAMTFAAAAGREISLGTQIVVQGINVSSILLSGTGVANGVYDLYMKYNDDENISSLDVLRLASSLLVFTHSINNLRLALKVSTSGKGATLRKQLSHEVRNSLDKLCRETGKLHQTTAPKIDVMRLVNDIPLKEVLMELPKLHANLPGQLLTAASVMSALPNGILSLTDANGIQVNLSQLATEFGIKFVQHIGSLSSLSDVLNAMVTYLTPQALNFLMRLVRIFIDHTLDDIDYVLNTFISTEAVLYKVLMHCVRNYSDFSYEYLEKKTTVIMGDIEKYFLSLNPNDTLNKRYKCEQCGGHYTQCPI